MRGFYIDGVVVIFVYVVVDIVVVVITRIDHVVVGVVTTVVVVAVVVVVSAVGCIGVVGDVGVTIVAVCVAVVINCDMCVHFGVVVDIDNTGVFVYYVAVRVYVGRVRVVAIHCIAVAIGVAHVCM